MKTIFFILILFCNLLFSQSLHDAIKKNDFTQFKSLIESDPKLITSTYQIEQHKTRNPRLSWLPKEITPLYDAILHSRYEVIDYLIAKNIDLTKDNHSIFLALLQKDQKIIESLRNNGARIINDTAPPLVPNILTTAIWLYPDNIELHKKLIEFGAGVNLDWDSNFTHTPLGMATRLMLPKVIKLLLENGAKLNLPRNNGQVGLHDAIYYGSSGKNLNGYSTESLNYLLEFGADKTLRDNNGNTPMEYAAIEGFLPALKILWDDSYDRKSINFDGMTLLHRTVIRGYYNCVKFLLSKNFDINAKDKYGKTPLDYSVLHNHLKITKLLKSKDAESNITVNSGEQKEPFKTKLKPKQAITWYLGRKNWVVKTQNNVFIFNNSWDENVPDNPSIMNGQLIPEELSDQKLFYWGNIKYLKKLISSDSHKLINPNSDKIVYMSNRPYNSKQITNISIKPDQSYESGSTKITKIGHNNWLIESDGVKLLFKLNSADFNEEQISKIRGLDIAYFSIWGSRGELPNSEIKSAEILIRNLKPKCLFYHSIYTRSYFHQEISNQLKRKNHPLELPAAKYPGDRFFYDSAKLNHLDNYYADISPLTAGLKKIKQIIDDKGFENGISECAEIIKKNEKEFYFFPEQLNSLGYQYLRSGKTKEAIQIFKWNVNLFPDDANTHDSLGEAYVTIQNKKSAIKSYKKAYAINNEKRVAKIIEELESNL